MKKALALVLALAMLFAFASCGDKKAETQTTAAPETEAVDATVQAESNETETETDSETTESAETTLENITNEETSADAEATTAASKKPTTAAEILAAYTAAVDLVKTEHPGFKKVEYQELPESKRNFSNDTVLKIAANFMTSKDKATKNPDLREKGYDGDWFPVYHSPKGCLLKDASAIKSAKCEEVAGGKYKITIVLKPEMNPEPPKQGATTSPSKVGAMFSPISKKDIDDTIKNNKLVNVFLKSAIYDLKYYDCTAILVYNPENNHIESLTHYMHVLITADAKLVIGSLKGDAVLDNSMFCTDFKY